MSSQSSRFGSASASPQPVYYVQQPANPTPTLPPQYPPAGQGGSVEYLLAQYTPDQRIKIKSENAQKYRMHPESPIYRLTPRFLESLVYRYPQEFPVALGEELRKNVGKMRRDYVWFNKLLWGGVLYWVALRRRTWFQLTGNAIMRVCFCFLCFNNIIDLSFSENEYLTQNAFLYNSQYEAVLQKYAIDPAALNKAELFS